MMEAVIETMKKNICAILRKDHPSLYLYGSITMDDFQPGWSDIDILCLTNNSISDACAHQLFSLRQELVQTKSDDTYRLFEGGFLPLNAFAAHAKDTVVYWGTSGQRITDTYHFDSFSMAQLLTNGRMLYGTDVRSQFVMPSYIDLRQDVIRHYQTIRTYAQATDGSLYACGWLLDIARCLYTLRTGKVIAKTAAGEWALREGLCNVPNTLQRTITVRKNPKAFKATTAYQAWASQLGTDVQKFARYP